jgi:hypothetical protein
MPLKHAIETSYYSGPYLSQGWRRNAGLETLTLSQKGGSISGLCFCRKLSEFPALAWSQETAKE